MILRGSTPRALTLTGLAAVLVLGLVLLPLVPTWAQDPPPAAAAQEKKKADDQPADEKEGEKARQEFQKIQEDLIKLQRQMEDKRRELETKLQDEFGKAQQDLIKRLREAAQKAGFPGAPPGAFAGALPPLIALPGNPIGNLQPGALPPAQIQPPAGLPFAAGPVRPDLERRLDDLERKLDKLLQRLEGGKAPPNRAPGGEPNVPQRNPGNLEAPPAARIPGAPLAPPAVPPEAKK